VNVDPTSREEAARLAQQVAADRLASQQERGLGSAPDVELNFEHAKASPVALDKTAAELDATAPTPERTTSFAKELDATRAAEQQPETSKTKGQAQQDNSGSSMAENDKPELKPTNRTREGQAMDRAMFNQDWADTQARTDEQNRVIAALAAKQQAMDAAQAQRQPEMGRGQGMG
jgi:hypothetical protein